MQYTSHIVRDQENSKLAYKSISCHQTPECSFNFSGHNIPPTKRSITSCLSDFRPSSNAYNFLKSQDLFFKWLSQASSNLLAETKTWSEAFWKLMYNSGWYALCHNVFERPAVIADHDSNILLCLCFITVLCLTLLHSQNQGFNSESCHSILLCKKYMK